MSDIQRGSFTIEASILIPFLILIMSGTILWSLDTYKEIKSSSEIQEESIWMVNKFYFEQGIMEVIEDGS